MEIFDMFSRTARTAAVSIRRLRGAPVVWLALLLCASLPAIGQETPPLVIAREFRPAEESWPNVCFPFSLKAATERAEAEALAPPTLDGRFDDPCWTQASELALTGDMPGGMATRATQVRVCYGAEALYVAVECQEPAMDNVPRIAPRTETLPSENVQVFLLPAGQKEGYHFAVGPNGSRYEARPSTGSAWSAPWQVRTARTSRGWSAELAIPFATLGASPTADTSWHANFCRVIASTGEVCSWQPTMGNLSNPELWGRMFFGTYDDFVDRVRAPRIAIRPERFVVLTDERTMQVAVRAASRNRPVSELTFHLRLAEQSPEETAPGDAPLAEFAAPMEAERLFFTLNLNALPMGRSYLTAMLKDKDGNAVARATCSILREESRNRPARLARLTVTVPGLGVDSPSARQWPVTTGVALPRGALHDPERARLLDPDGNETALETLVRARWPDGSIRWLGMDFRADLSGDAPRRFVLEYGETVKRKSVRGFVRKFRNLPFDVVGYAWVINTGRVLFTVNQERFAGIEEAWVDVDQNGRYDWPEQIINGSRGGIGPYIEDAAGNAYTFPEGGQVHLMLEEWNNLRLVLRAEGPLILSRRVSGGDEMSRPPESLGRCIMRITAYANQWFVKLQYTFVLNKAGAGSILRDVAVRTRLDFAGRFDAVLGLPDGYRKSIRDADDVYLMWIQPDRYVVGSGDSETDVSETGTIRPEWAVADAWDRGLAIAFQDMADLYPKSFSLHSDNTFKLHFWPPHGRDDLRRYAGEVNRRTVGGLHFAQSGRLFDLRVPGPYSHALKDKARLEDFEAVSGMHLSDPTGLALTYETLWIFYRGDLDRNDVAGASQLLAEAPHGVQDRESLIRSGVLDGVLSPERTEKALALAAHLLEREEHFPEKGDLNFRDVHRAWLSLEERWALAQRWMGPANDLPGALWLLYLQSGSERIRTLARQNLRHLFAVDICHDAEPAQMRHADPRRRKLPGGFGDHATPLHWHSTCHINDRFARLRALAWSYYLTGDHRAREAALLWARSAETFGLPARGQDGAVFMDNLRVALGLRYNPVLLERLGACASYFSDQSLNPSAMTGWNATLSSSMADRGDPGILKPLRDLANRSDAVEAAKSRFELLGLFRDLERATGNQDYAEDRALSLELFEKSLERALQGTSPLESRFSWADLAAYVFGGMESPHSESPEGAAEPGAE